MELTHEAEVLRAGDLEVRPAEHLALAKGRVLALLHFGYRLEPEPSHPFRMGSDHRPQDGYR